MSDDDDDSGMDVDFDDPDDPPAVVVVPLKGRKRFLADLDEMRKISVVGFTFQGFDLRSRVLISILIDVS